MFAVVCKKATGEFRIKGGCVLLPKDTISQALSTEKRKKFEDNDISFLLITRYQYKKLVANHGGHLAHWDKDGNCRGAGCIIDCICMGDEYKELVLLVVKFANAVEPEEYFPLLDSAFDTITRKVDVVVAGRLCCGESLQVHGTCVISNKRPLVVLNTACPSQLIGSPIIAIIGHETRLIGIHCGVKGDCVGFSFGVRIRECIGYKIAKAGAMTCMKRRCCFGGPPKTPSLKKPCFDSDGYASPGRSGSPCSSTQSTPQKR